MIGDPKQAIKYPNSFIDYITKYNTESRGVVFEPINNITRRVPNSLLKISNEFCYKGQEQTNYYGTTGCVKYIYNDTSNFFIMLQQALLKGKHVIINQKNDYYQTHEIHENHFPRKPTKILEDAPLISGKDKGLYINSIYLDLLDSIESGLGNRDNGAAISVIRKHNLWGLFKERSGYGMFYEFAEQCSLNKTKSSTIVKSIESVKGLDSDVVFFILTESNIKYLNHIKNPVESPFNKEWKKLYVALTRSCEKFIFVLDKRMVGEERLAEAELYFREKNVGLIDDAIEILNWFE